MKDNTTRPGKGLFKDNPIHEQPESTYTFALNAVNNTDEGDQLLLTNEEGNEICGTITSGYIPIGQVYVGNNEIVVFSTNGTSSEIGLLDNNCNYSVLVNTNLDFRIEHQIDATFRLRRGCERTIYWVDGFNHPRNFNLDSPESFQTAGNWDIGKFDLVRTYDSIPTFIATNVLNSGGQLEPGSYNIAVQYLDEDFNSTEWVTTSPTINIYNDSTNLEYLDINGSIKGTEDYNTFEATSKSIEVILGNLDTSFLFYRLAFIEATSGNGDISDIKITENIPTNNDTFIFDGTNFVGTGTAADISAFTNIIGSAGSIEQIENRLVMGNTKGKQVNFCLLQEYASRITADAVIKRVVANTLTDSNPKKPDVHLDGVGYMPGEIYSFGIVYIFSDGSVSPVYHIPGKNPNVDNDVIYSPGTGVVPMNNDNQSDSNTYFDNNECTNRDYWGVDSEGAALTGASVRHHRFPTRDELRVPLFEEVGSNDNEVPFYRVELTIDGTIDTPCSQDQFDNGECSPVKEALPFQAEVEYTVDGQTFFFRVNINPADFFTQGTSYVITLVELSELHASNNIVITDIRESADDGTATSVTSGTSPKGLTYATQILTQTQVSVDKVFETTILGIQFSNVEIPSPSITNNEEIVGYYIVRNERKESDKTILDSGVLVPCGVNQDYISHGLLNPEYDDPNKLSKNVFGLIHPENKFLNKQYTEFDEIVHQGSFEINQRNKSVSRYLDVQDGSSFDEDNNKGSDEDGWSLKAIIRDGILMFKNVYSQYNILRSNIKDIFYLNALESRTVNDNTDNIFNISADNRIGIINLDQPIETDFNNRIPYVYIKRSINNSYANYRLLPYFKVSTNPVLKSQANNDVTTVFGGDTYLSSMRYVSTVFWDNRIAERAVKRSVWQIVAGSLLVLAGVFLAIIPGLQPGAALLLGAGITIVGGGALFISSGIKQDAWAKAYQEEYRKGLRDTVLDNWVDDELNYKRYNNVTTPQDDEIQWIADCYTNLFFESQINFSLRYKMTTDAPNFLNAPGRVESGNDQPEQTGKDNVALSASRDVFYTRDVSIYPITPLERHIMSKLLAFDPTREDNRLYIGHPLGEWYEINPDYQRFNKEKIYFHLPIQFDCCSDCQEVFPHRVVYSEASFQEEIADNYKNFLPNNFRDIEGETGAITDLFRLKKHLYIHTEENLWHLPSNLQERVTEDVISFIGTGSFFNIPPRKITDEYRASGGCRHPWATIKTKYGVFFISEAEGRVYHFDGNSLKPISSTGLYNWFFNNLPLISAREYLKIEGKRFPYENNPSNPFGAGFISTYDVENERIIFTKKDFTLIPAIVNESDFEICTDGNQLTVFEDYQQRIDQREADGWVFAGIEDCRMKFERVVLNTVTETRERLVSSNSEIDIHVFYDTSGSFGIGTLQEIIDGTASQCLVSINETIDTWIAQFAADNNWSGTLYKYADSTERWLSFPEQVRQRYITDMIDPNTKDVLVISFCNEAAPRTTGYHNFSDVESNMPIPSNRYIQDRLLFLGTTLPEFNSFQGINYPIVFGANSVNCNTAGSGELPESRNFLLHSIAALEGTELTNQQLNQIIPNRNLGFDEIQWATLRSSLQNNNPYDDDGLKNYGWTGKWDRYAKPDGTIITPEEFQLDVQELIQGELVPEEFTIEIQVPTTEVEYEDGTTIPGYQQEDNSFTISYSLKNQTWTSWHSYLPIIYFYLPESFSSFVQGNNNFWKHNIRGLHQNFYGEQEAFTVEYVSASTPIQTRIFEDISWYSEARRYNENNDLYDERFVTFNKAILYNSKQCTGELQLQVKDQFNNDYLENQIVKINPDTIIIDNNEESWNLNDIRDIVVDYNVPFFLTDLPSRQTNYYNDKVLNPLAIDFNKSWQTLESLRDKYMVVRLILDNRSDVKLVFNYSIETENPSFR